MMKRFILFIFFGLLFVPHAQSQSTYWRNGDGSPAEETASMKSKNDFGGMLLAITDEDWEKKWNTPPETKPNFNKAEVVPYGKKVFILTFFSNPKNDNRGNVNVRCDIALTEPTGKVSLNQKDLVCFTGRLAGNPYNLYLSAPVITFSGDPGDPPGTWLVEVKLRDEIGNVELSIGTNFELK